jgi:hypothetical protein
MNVRAAAANRFWRDYAFGVDWGSSLRLRLAAERFYRSVEQARIFDQVHLAVFAAQVAPMPKCPRIAST